MRRGRRWPAVALVSTAFTLAIPAWAQTPPPTSSPRPAASPSGSPPARPVSDSVDRVVERLEDARTDPCKKAREEGRPCFPVSTTVYGPEFSVRDSLRTFDYKNGPTPGGPPTTSQMGPYRPGPKALVVPLVTFDPGCVAKAVLKGLKGKNDVYFLYHLRDTQGDRVVLFDRRIDAATFQGDVEFLGRFEGECDAVAAYRHEQLVRTPPRPTMPYPSASPGPAPRPSPTPVRN